MPWSPELAQAPREAEIKLLQALLKEDNLSHYDLKMRYKVSNSVSNAWLPRLLTHGFATMRQVAKGGRIKDNYSLTSQGKVWAWRRIDEFDTEQGLRNSGN